METGFTLVISKGIFGNPMPFQRSYQTEILDWEQEHSQDGGMYRSATFKIAIEEAEIDNWLENGLIRNVVAYSPHGQVIGEYFVNMLTVEMAYVTVSRGPITEMANRVSVQYTPYIDITVDPPTTGEQTSTVIVEDADSQAKYGIIEKIFNHGSLVDDATYTGGGPVFNEAESIRDAYLEDMKSPITTQEFKSNASSGIITLTLDCLGYGAVLDLFIYDNAFDLTATTVIPTKIQSILAYEPNGVISTDYSGINDDAEFLQLTPEGAEGTTTGKSIIDDMVAQGDAYNNRAIFLILNDRKAYYDKISQQIDYVIHLKDKKIIFETQGGVEVYPWEIRPGKWLFFAGFMIGRAYPTAPDKDDPRCEFIESVRFKMPNTVEITGYRLSILPQLLKKIDYTVS